MDDASTSLFPSASSALPSPLPSMAAVDPSTDPVPAHHVNPVVAFIIGLVIILLASILNAAGLNLTKLDHVRTSEIPKANRRKDWARPLWLLGMVLYILSQLLGSTLALEYMRAEYVAPLGSTSLIFNFMFAKFLIHTPVTNNDIYGTIIVILGVVGIVAFGSINSGLGTETNAAHLTSLWTRGNWLAYFFCMAFALIFVYIFVSQLDLVLSSRSDLSAVPFAAISARGGLGMLPPTTLLSRLGAVWERLMLGVRERLEVWTASHDDKRIAWTLGIGWACCGGGLAGGTLVFAKAAVKLISGSLSHENTGNQFGHASVIFTFILLAVTAVFQIICLNRGLKVYDSTLVVPVFYGVYTGTGFLNSLIFNNEVDAYHAWTLFFIFCSMMILIAGVVLLTFKKPDTGKRAATIVLESASRRLNKGAIGSDGEPLADGEEGSNGEVVWQLGEASDDEDGELRARSPRPGARGIGVGGVAEGDDERRRMIDDGEEEETENRGSTSSDRTLAQPHSSNYADEFDAWKSV